MQYEKEINNEKGVNNMDDDKQQYTVVILFTNDGSKVLLQQKDRTRFRGMLNGVGGKIEPGELPIGGAIREIKEETTLTDGDVKELIWLGTLTIPESCDGSCKVSELIFYGGVIEDEHKACTAYNMTEEVNWYPLNNDNTPVTDLPLAGDGNLPYFIGMARKHLFDKVRG